MTYNNLVTIVTPTYKRHKEILDRSIQSLLTQSHKNIEVIVVDDNPPDSPYRIEIKKYIETMSDERVVYIQNHKNIGGALSRNVGIFKSKGDFITFLDDDDIYLPDKIKNQLSLMIKYDSDLTFTDLKICNENNDVIDYRKFDFILDNNNDSLMRYHLTRNLTGTPTFMFKSEALKNIDGFDNVKMGHEFYLMYKSIESGLSIRYLPICDVVAYRTKADSISNGMEKIEGENQIYRFKKSKYDILNKNEKEMIEFRHRAVLAVAYKRRNKYLKMIITLVDMFFTSPKYSVTEGYKFINNYLKGSKEKNIWNYMID